MSMCMWKYVAVKEYVHHWAMGSRSGSRSKLRLGWNAEPYIKRITGQLILACGPWASWERRRQRSHVCRHREFEPACWHPVLFQLPPSGRDFLYLCAWTQRRPSLHQKKTSLLPLLHVKRLDSHEVASKKTQSATHIPWVPDTFQTCICSVSRVPDTFVGCIRLDVSQVASKKTQSASKKTFFLILISLRKRFVNIIKRNITEVFYEPLTKLIRWWYIMNMHWM